MSDVDVASVAISTTLRQQNGPIILQLARQRNRWFLLSAGPEIKDTTRALEDTIGATKPPQGPGAHNMTKHTPGRLI